MSQYTLFTGTKLKAGEGLSAKKVVDRLLENDDIPDEPAEEKQGISSEELETFIADPANQVTPDQAEALREVRTRWVTMEKPQVDFLNGCIMVPVGADVNPMWLGIEKDGYTKEHADRAYAKFQTMPRSKSNLVLAINLTR